MARRRGPRGGGLSTGINQLLNLYMQDYFARRRAGESQAANLGQMREQQGIDTAQGILTGVQAGQIRPEAFPPELAARIGGMDTPYALAPTQQALEQPGLEQIREASTQAEVPDIETLIGERAARGRIGASWLPLGSDTETPSQLGPLHATLAAREARLGSINTAQEGEMDRKFAEAQGVARSTGLGQEQATAQAFPAELNRKLREGQQSNQLEQDQFKAMTPLESGRAGAVETAQERARLSPQFIDARVDEYLRARPPTVARPTDAAARASGLFPILIEAHEGLKGYENKRIDLGLGTATLSQVPGGARLLNPDQKGLVQFANSYLNVASLILTGVTARPDEYTRYLSTYVGFHGDDDLNRARKARARELFNEAVMKRAQTGGATSVTEVMDDVDALLEQAFPGEPPQLPDGIPPDDPAAVRQWLEQNRPR